jgi:AraC-like DNA-binding protein
MNYQRIEPDSSLSQWVDCYWFADSMSAVREKKKIIPDGFPEIIFHYRDPYRINISGSWHLQSKALFAGQLRKFFYLENTGASGMVGIKFKPAALAHFFNLNMIAYTGQVLSLQRVIGGISPKFKIHEPILPEQMANVLNQELRQLIKPHTNEVSIVNRCLDLIFSRKGNLEVAELLNHISITERQLQRLFNRYVGLAPKFYCRIVRFSHIFSLMEQQDASWVEIALESGYYDQSHFIRNFKAFTGEDPSAYLFEEESLANFFMKRT